MTSTGFSERRYLKQTVCGFFVAAACECSILSQPIRVELTQVSHPIVGEVVSWPCCDRGQQKQGDRFEAKLLQSHYSGLISLFPAVPLAAHACICFRKIEARCEYFICKAKKQNLAFIVVNRVGPAN